MQIIGAFVRYFMDKHVRRCRELKRSFFCTSACWQSVVDGDSWLPFFDLPKLTLFVIASHHTAYSVYVFLATRCDRVAGEFMLGLVQSPPQ